MADVVINVEELIKRLQQEKCTKPEGVMYESLKLAVSTELRKILNSMYANHKIQVHKTLNSQLIVYVAE